jgi:hypothetical protein
MIKATSNDMSMPVEALIGIGLMYGPINPDTKAIGIKAAMTVKVAKIVGLPTSSTALGIRLSRFDFSDRVFFSNYI